MDKVGKLRADLSRLLERFGQGDRAAVAGPTATRTADRLRRLADRTTADGQPAMNVVDAYLLAYFHWFRYQALPPGDRAGEIEPIRQLFTSLLALAPDLVPPDVCNLLTSDPQEQVTMKILVLSASALEHRNRAQETRDVGELDTAIELLRATVEHIATADLPAGVASGYHFGLSQAWLDRYEWAGEPADLDQAIAQSKAALAAAPPAAEAGFDYSGELDKLLTLRFDRTGRPEHLDAIVTERAARVAGSAGESRGRWRRELAFSLEDRFELGHDLADLREAIRQARAAAAELSGDDRGQALVLLFQLQAEGLQAREPTVDLSDLIAAGAESLKYFTGHDVMLSVRVNLGVFYLRRYHWHGDSADLADALDQLNQAVEILPAGDDRTVVARSNLAEALVNRHHETVRESAAHGYSTSVFSDLEQAIELLNWCLDQTSDGVERARRLRNLAHAYRVGADDERSDLLDLAVVALREALSISGADRSEVLQELEMTLRSRFIKFQHEPDLAEAIGVSEQAVASAAAGTWEELMASLGLAEGLALRLTLDQPNDDDRRTAMEIYRSVAHTESAGLQARVSASYAWARVAHDGGDLQSALDGYQSMLTLMEDMAPVELDDTDRLRLLAGHDWRPAAGVACAVAAGQLERAVELLEQGRLMTAPPISAAAGEVEALRQRHPDLAALVDSAHAELDATADRHGAVFLPLGVTVVSEDWHDKRQRSEAAARNWRDTVAQVRQVPGYEGFLASAGFPVLSQAAKAGPVVVLNASVYRCDALLIRTDGVEVVPLPVTDDEVVARVNDYVGAISKLNAVARTLADRMAAEDKLRRVLSWLWDSTMQPILAALGSMEVVTDGPWPRVWWSPGGPFSLLPLHAAGRTPEDGVLDRVQSSYAPSLRLLASLNSVGDERASSAGHRLLAVGLAETPRLRNSRLPEVDRELAAVMLGWPPESLTVLRDEQATRAAVEQALPAHDVLHFACHGRQYPRRPLSSELYLYDRALSVQDLRRSSLRRTRLAVLSACQTALSGNTLLDEGLHLGAALHLAGCRDVVGTLWTVPDSSAASVMESLYEYLRRDDGLLKPGLAAEALHFAVRELRSEAADLYGAWAPYVHIGGGT